jgi:hypothetical protein
LNSLTTALEDSLFAYLSRVPPGAPVRRAKLVQLAMSDDRVEDAKVLLTPQGQEPVEELTLDSGVALDVLRPFNFPRPTFAQGAAAAATTATVTATLPLHLAPEITLTQASDAIQVALNGFLASRRTDTPLTVDAMAAAIRDDSRFALVRANVILTVESGTRFLQLTDGLGSYAPATNETLLKGNIDIQPREGGV